MKTSQIPPAALPLETLHLQTLPLRLQTMVTQILAYQDVLCSQVSGSIEFHFNNDKLKVKIILLPEP